jgi:mono/diheme cytochrome c family protein
VLTAAIVANTVALAQSTSPDGQALYLEHCASCHGANLEGQPDWMRRLPNGRLPAPPHDETGHTWHHSDEQLLVIVRDGLATIAPGYETDMPAFGPKLDDREIMAILGYIKQTWPDREREIQQSR